MSSFPPNLDRRHALKFLAGVPMLPLTGASLASLLTACGSDTVATPIAKFASASFDSMAVPTLANAAAMATTTVASNLNVLLSDNTTQTYKLAYQSFFTQGRYGG